MPKVDVDEFEAGYWMDVLAQFLQHTPWWVYALFAYLITRGIAARAPGEVSFPKLAIIPVLLTVWILSELVRLYGVTPSAIAMWLFGTVIGIAIGWLLLHPSAITVDPGSRLIHRPADYTLLPLLLITFAVKYAFGAIGSTSPAMLQESVFRAADLGLSGLFRGIFIGKFAVYAAKYSRLEYKTQ